MKLLVIKIWLLRMNQLASKLQPLLLLHTPSGNEIKDVMEV
jgi:hypothetical protein